MDIKKFLVTNKVKIVKCLGALMMCIGVIGIGSSLIGGKNPVEEKDSKIHLLCIGVDKHEIMSEREQVYNSLGQADGIFLITIDEDEKTVDIVAVPRDTVVTLQKYYSNMEYMGEEEAQICLQYAYADGMEKSCELTVDRVEELFPGIIIDGYVAINFSSIEEINDVIGGVTVEVHDEDTAEKMGVEVNSTVHLTYENITTYLRSRDKEESGSAYGRMERYKDYVKAFIPRALEVVKENPMIVGEVVEVLGENLVTDISITDIVAMAKNVAEISAEDITYCTLEGSVILAEDGYEEFHPDAIKLKEIIKKIK